MPFAATCCKFRAPEYGRQDTVFRKRIRGGMTDREFEKKYGNDSVDNELLTLVEIGVALSAEKDINRVLEMIINAARWFTDADGGTLYIKNKDRERLDFAIVRNNTLNIKMGGAGDKIAWPPVSLRNPDGGMNHRNVCAHCAIVGKAVHIADVYNAEGFDFQGTRDFDANTGYRSKSMLVIPMRDHEDEVVGVLQLLNAVDRKTGLVVDFPARKIGIISGLASQAATAITKVRLIKGLENLLDSFVKSIATAIDEKSPHTAGHIRRVAELMERIAHEINQVDDGRFARAFFKPEELVEIRMAAWMHDVGKICIPEYVVDKATKLETIFDRIETIRYRIEIMKREAEIRWLKTKLAGAAGKEITADESAGRLQRELREYDEYLAFLETVNKGSEFLPDDSITKLQLLAGLSVGVAARQVPLLSADELKNLAVRRGTISPKEREIINNHVSLTIKMLADMPFPKKMRNVPLYAGMHHEKLDGSGYPRGLAGDDIPLAARILAVADVFEALTAADRPYKPAKSIAESMRILEHMAANNHLDADVCNLIVESGVVADYTALVRDEDYQDEFIWKGKKYTVRGSKARKRLLN